MNEPAAPKNRTEGLPAGAPSDATGSSVNWVEALYRQHFQEILGFIARKVGEGPPDPEDVAQQTFEAIAKHKAPETIENKRAYLFRTAANAITSFRRHAAVELRFAKYDLGVQKIFGEGDGLSPERVLLDRENIDLVVAAIEKLPRRRRRLLLLNRIEGVSYAALARRYNVTEGTIRKQVGKAMTELAEYAPGFEDSDAGHDAGK